MYPHSSRMDDAVRNGGAKPVLAVQVYEGATLIDTPTLNVVGGRVITDATDSRSKRATLELIAEDGDLVPDEARDLFSVAESRNFVPLRGFDYGDGSPEWIPQGSFVITSITASETTEGIHISITGEDDSLRVSDNKYVQAFPTGLPPGYVGPGQDVADVIRNIWFDRFPGAGNKGVLGSMSGFEAPRTIPSDNQDPWQLALQFAAAIGWWLLLNNDDLLEMGPIPDPYAPGANVVWTYHDDGANSDNPPITTQLTVSEQRDNVYSGVLAVGSNSFGIDPPRALVWDDDPNSPTYYLGRFGRKTYDRPPDEKLLSQAQATAAAIGDLNRYKGLPQVVTINQMIHPALTVKDIIRADYERSGIHALYTVDRIELPLSITEPMVTRCRERRISA